MHSKSLWLVFVIVLLTAAGLAQQSGESLGEVARKERERRKTQAQPKVVLTNDGLIKKEGENPQSAPKPTTQSAEGGQQAAGGIVDIPATPTLSVNGKQTKLTHVIAVPNEDVKGSITVILSDVPVTEKDAHSFVILAVKAGKGELHAATITFDAASQVIGFDVYDPAFAGGHVTGGWGKVNFHRKTFDGGTVAGTVTTPNVEFFDVRYQVAGTFTAQIVRPPRPLTEAESSQVANKPAVKVVMAYIDAARAKDVERMKLYMTPELARQLDAMSPAQQKALIDLEAEDYGNTSLRVTKYTETGNTAEVELVGGQGGPSVMKLVLVGGSWKIAPK